MELRPYQTGQLDAVASAFNSGQTRVLVKSPTGTGKTVMFARMPAWPTLGALFDGRSKGAGMLVIAHREELLRQSQAKIQAANPGLAVSIEQGELHASRYSDVIVASIQTLAARKYARLERLLQHHTFRIVVVDEAHHSAAPSYRTVLARLGFLPMSDASDKEEAEAVDYTDIEEMTAALTGWEAVAPKDRLLVGVTATPNRSDAIGLGCVFQTIAYSYGLKEAIADGWLVPIKPWVIETAENLDQVRISHGDFKQNELADAVNTPRRNALAVQAWQAYAGGASTIAFSVDVKHAEDLAAAFRAAGVEAQTISGETDKDERRYILERFQKGQFPVITNCMVLTEGTDLPIAGCILHAKPTKSATLYEQMTGRGLRLYPGKSECVVLDLVDVARRHSLMAAPALVGLPPGLKTKGEDLRKLSDEIDALRERIPDLDALLQSHHYTLEELRARARSFDVFAMPMLGELAEILSMNWIKLSESSFRVSYPWGDGKETITVEPDALGKFTVALTLRPQKKEGQPWPAPRQRTLAADLATAGDALACAESFLDMQRPSVYKLKDRTAPWRARPASPKQIQYLEKLQSKYPAIATHLAKKLTAGQASDLLDLASARSGR